MADESTKEEKQEKQECFCKSKGFRDFLTMALATFVGVYAALCLFTALNRPPMMPPYPCGFRGMPPFGTPCHFKNNHHRFNKEFQGNFHKEMKPNNAPAPFDKDRHDD